MKRRQFLKEAVEGLLTTGSCNALKSRVWLEQFIMRWFVTAADKIPVQLMSDGWLTCSPRGRPYNLISIFSLSGPSMEFMRVFVTLFFCVEALLLSVGCARPVLLTCARNEVSNHTRTRALGSNAGEMSAAVQTRIGHDSAAPRRNRV